MKMTEYDYKKKVSELNTKYPSLNAVLNVSKFGGRLEIEVSTVEKAKALYQCFPKFNFTSGLYK